MRKRKSTSGGPLPAARMAITLDGELLREVHHGFVAHNGS
jgi:hypothetical protein